MKALYKKEIMHYLNNPVGFIVPSLFALFMNYLFIKDVFVIGSASMIPFFSLAPWLLFLFLPALSMASFSEEKRTNTIEVLLTLPLSEHTVVTAKWLSLMTMASITLVLTLSTTLVLGILTPLYLPELLVGYFGLLLLTSLYLSFSLYVSSLVSNQIAAFIISSITLFIVTGLSSDLLANILPKAAQDILLFASPILHVQNFAKGIIDLRSLFFFVGLSVLFVQLTITQLQKRQ